MQGSLDADRLAGAPRARHAAQHRSRASAASATSTPTWCARRSRDLPLDEIDLLVIENVGNLVCPAEFRVGEDARVMVSSVTEGEDKPLKYPLMFRTCDLVLVNKIDLLPHLDFDLDKFLYNLDQVHPDVRAHARERADGRGHRRRGATGCTSVAAARGGACVTAPVAGATARVWTRCSSGAPRPTRRSSTAEAERLARLCHLMAERFARGGRLVAFGRSPAARSDARHVAVEFVHPVIVGKRALPAIGLAGEGGDLAAQVELLARPTTSRSRSGPTRTAARPPARWPSRARAAA